MRSADLYILTGAPGSGKTAILDNLGSDIRCVGEPAREVLVEQRSVGGAGTPDRDPSLFVNLLLGRSIDKHETAQRWEGSVVFDRGVPDCVAYAALMGTDPAPSILASEVYRYHREALVFEPLEEIYAVDDERTMSFADTVAFQGRSGIRTNEPDIPSSRWLETRSKTERLSFEISSSIARANGEDVRGCVSSMSHIRRIFYTRFMGKRHASGENVLESWRFFVPLGTLLAARSSTTTRGGPGPS